VRLQTADHISIEMTDNNRMSAVVVDCSVDRLLLAVGGGPLVRLECPLNTRCRRLHPILISRPRKLPRRFRQKVLHASQPGVFSWRTFASI